MAELLIFLIVGLIAQTVDGALGMAYGLVASSSLLAFGVSPLEASAAVHAAKLFTCAASGAAHWWHGNVSPPLFGGLAIAGAAGGVAGALLLGHADSSLLKPWVAAYLAAMGGYLVWRSFRARRVVTGSGLAQAAPLGLVGGLLDAVGGGGWGPVVTSGLLASGVEPRKAVGSVNAAEFAVSVTVSIAFVLIFVGVAPDGQSPSRPLAAIAGLVVGGLVAAPFAALLVRHIERTSILRLVGFLVVSLAAFQIVRLVGA